MSRRPKLGDRVTIRMPGGGTKQYVLGPDIDLDEEVVLDANGERITEARAQQMAEDIMQDYYRRAGRPSLTGGRKHSPQVSFRVPEQLARRAEEAAARHGKTLSQLGREALEQYLDRAG